MRIVRRGSGSVVTWRRAQMVLLSAQGMAPTAIAKVDGLAGALTIACREALTARELEVLGMLAAGRSNRAIAGELVVTLDTVKKHVSHVMGKLGAANRTEAVARGAGTAPDPLTRRP